MANALPVTLLAHKVSDPAMAVFDGKLCVGFRANDQSNAVWIASSPDGVHFESHVLPNQFMGGNSSPTLAIDGDSLYCLYGANDAGNEMIVTASTDGSTWQGLRAYLDVQIGEAGPSAGTLFYSNGDPVVVGFQSNDPRKVLFTTLAP